MATSTNITEALARIADECPTEARILREHLDSLLMHPMVLAERAIRSTEGAAHELTGLRETLDKVECHLAPIMKLQADALVLDVEERKLGVAERKANARRAKESGAWTRDAASAVGGWLAKRSEAAIALVLGALALWFAAWLGVDIPLIAP